MSVERSRGQRFDSQPIPLTWEVPLLVGLGISLLAVMTPLVVQAITCAVLVGDLAWPSKDLGAGLAGLARGEFGVALPTPAAEALPGDLALWIVTFVGELAILVTVVILGRRLRSLLGTRNRSGLATAALAADALGLQPLRRRAAVVRPDLFGGVR